MPFAKECFASGETCFQSCGELDPLQPDPQLFSQPGRLVRSSCFSKSCFFSMEAWQIQHGKDDDDTDIIHRMQILQLNRQTHSQMFLHNFTCTTNTYTYRIITAGTVGVLTSARHGLVKQAASHSFSALRLVLPRVEVCVVGSVEDVMQLTTSDSIQSRT